MNTPSPVGPMTVRAFHGTTRSFDVFDAQAPQASGSVTAQWGTFFSACPRIAAHFTLDPDVVDAGYDTEEGSRSLVCDPWQFGATPFQAGAHVIEAEVALQRPKVMDALSWMELVESIHSHHNPVAQVLDLRREWEAAGHDGLLIQAWDRVSADDDGVKPSVETDADTYVLFDARQVRILGRREAATCWPLASPGPPRRRLR